MIGLQQHGKNLGFSLMPGRYFSVYLQRKKMRWHKSGKSWEELGRVGNFSKNPKFSEKREVSHEIINNIIKTFN
jgi:hypothetical protein